MRTPRFVAMVLCWIGMAAAGYVMFVTKLPQGVIVLIVVAAFIPYLLWLRVEPFFERRGSAESPASAGVGAPDGGPPLCAACRRPILVDPAASHNIFEGMHWLCFHLEFEHDTDADLPCSDPGCPQAVREIYEAKLREFGADPRQVLEAAIRERYR